MFGNDLLVGQPYPDNNVGQPITPTLTADRSRIATLVKAAVTEKMPLEVKLANGAPVAEAPPMIIDSGRGYMMAMLQYKDVITNMLTAFWVVQEQDVGNSKWYILQAGGAPPSPSSPMTGADLVKQIPEGVAVVVSVAPTADPAVPVAYKIFITTSETEAQADIAGANAAIGFVDRSQLQPPFNDAPFVLQQPANWLAGPAPGPQEVVAPETKDMLIKLGVGAGVLLLATGGVIYLIAKKKKKRATPNPGRRTRRRRSRARRRR